MKNLEKEYTIVREIQNVNEYISVYIQCFNFLSDSKTDDLPSLIREVQTYRGHLSSIQDRMKAEQLLRKNVSVLDPNSAFKKDTLTGYICHIIRDIIFFSGCVCNMSYAMPEAFNTVHRYRYLIGKKSYLNSHLNELGNFLN
jgi:hypothetical protein